MLQGLVYKKGKFSVLEEQQLNSAIEQYRQVSDFPNHSHDERVSIKHSRKVCPRTNYTMLYFPRTKGIEKTRFGPKSVCCELQHTSLNVDRETLAAAVPQRPIIAVYHHVRRSHHPLRLQGKWTPEEDSRLRTCVLFLSR